MTNMTGLFNTSDLDFDVLDSLLGNQDAKKVINATLADAGNAWGIDFSALNIFMGSDDSEEVAEKADALAVESTKDFDLAMTLENIEMSLDNI